MVVPGVVAVPYPQHPAPPNLTMPDFSKSPGGFGTGATCSDQTFYLAVFEEYSECAVSVDRVYCGVFVLTSRWRQGAVGNKISLAVVPLIYNATSA